jgi:hypothetical protein
MFSPSLRGQFGLIVNRTPSANMAAAPTYTSGQHGVNLKGSFCITRKEGREMENRGRKVLHETLKEMAERIQSTEEEHGVKESLLA